MFSEEYQVETIKQYFPVFDAYRKKFLVGEMLWNLADFATKQGKYFCQRCYSILCLEFISHHNGPVCHSFSPTSRFQSDTQCL